MPRNAKMYRADPEVIHSGLAQLSWMPGYEKVAENPKGLKLFEGAVQTFADDRETENETLGKVIPFEWMLKQIATTCTFFPKPIEMRKIYTKHFWSLDGYDPAELEERIEA